MLCIPENPVQDEVRPILAGDWLWALLLCAAALIYTGFYFDRGLDAFDEGLFAAEAERIRDGGVYGEDFLAPYGPGRYYLIALLFEFFGPSMKVQAGLWLALRVLVAFLTFFVGRRFLPAGLALLPAVVVIAAPGALHKGFFQTVALLNILAYLAYRRRPLLRFCTLAGMAAGVGALFRVDAGVFGFLSFMVLLALEPLWDRPRPSPSVMLKRAAAFAAGAALPTLPVFLYLLAFSDLGMMLAAEWHRTLTVSGFAGTLDLPGFGESLRAPSTHTVKFFLLALMIRTAPAVYLLLAVTVVVNRVRRSSGNGGLALLAPAVFGLPVLNQVRITPTFNHLLHAVPLVMIAGVLLFWIVGASRPLSRLWHPKPRQALAAILAVVFCAVPIFYNLVYTRGVLPPSIRNRFTYTESLGLERAGIYETPEHAREIRKIVAYITSTTRPGDPLFAGPFAPALNFLADRPPAVRYLEPFYYFRSPELQNLVVEDLARTRPPLVILEPGIWVGSQGLEKDAPAVYHFIRQHYRRAGSPLEQPDRYQIWYLPEGD